MHPGIALFARVPPFFPCFGGGSAVRRALARPREADASGFGLEAVLCQPWPVDRILAWSGRHLLGPPAIGSADRRGAVSDRRVKWDRLRTQSLLRAGRELARPEGARH